MCSFLGITGHFVADWEMKSVMLTCNCNFVKVLKTLTKKRLAHYVDNANYKCATMLDPRFKLSWCQEDEEQSLKELLLGKLAAVPIRDYQSLQSDFSRSPPNKRCKVNFNQTLHVSLSINYRNGTVLEDVCSAFHC